MAAHGKQVALVAPCLSQAKTTKLFGQCKQQGHIWSTKAPDSALASPVLTPLHPASGTRATPAAAGTLPQASAWGHEPGITSHKSCHAPGLGKQRGGETFL